MTLEGAINFSETNLYTIYTMNSASAGQYCVVLPKNNNGMYNMLVDLHMKSLFDSVNSGSKTKEDLVGEIGKEYDSIKTKYSDAILVIPMFDESNYINIINTDDKQKMFDEVKKIGAITSELYKKLIDSGIDKQKIDQKIVIIEKNDYDKKFVEWLIGQMPNFVSGINVSEFAVANDNPFMESTVANADVNNIFGAPVVENVNVMPNDDSVNSVTSEQTPVEPVQNVQPVVEEQPQIPNIFGEQTEVVQQPVQPVSEAPVVEQPVQQPVVNQSIEEPKPVQNVELDKTVTFSPVNDGNVAGQPVQTAALVENVAPVGEVNNVSVENTNVQNGTAVKKSNGFVNLAILLVILVGVTLASIELGKFLYNTYGV